MLSNFVSKVIIVSLASVWVVYSISVIVREPKEPKPIVAADPAPLRPLAIQHISVDQYLAAMDRKDVIVIDSRAEPLYQVHHLEGAIHCTLADIKNGSSKGHEAFQAASNKDVFVYCSADGCGNSKLVAEFIQYWPAKSVNVINGGLSALLSVLTPTTSANPNQ